VNKKRPELVERRTSPWREIVEVFYAEIAADEREPEAPAEVTPPKKGR
jgi:hypothetical protein